MKIDPRFTKEAGFEIFTGNELLVKGALETPGGVNLHTGYPGSPIAGYFDCLESISPLLKENGVVAKMANNEALAVAMVNGSQMAGCRSICAFKSVGLHVASDALALGVLAGTDGVGGGLIVCGDDPWSDSTQVPADSRYLAQHCRLPMVEPSNAQEVKDWVALSFELGQAGKIYIGYLITVAMADGGSTVACSPNHFPQVNENQKKTLSYEKDIAPNLERSVLLPPRTGNREIELLQSFAAIKQEARKLGINKILQQPQKDEQVPLGFVAAGITYSYLTHALYELGLTGKIPVLKLGMTYPVDEKIVIEFASRCQQIVVIEERRDFVESQITAILNPLMQEGKLDCKIYGKQFPKPHPGIPATRGLNPSLLISRLAPLLMDHPSVTLGDAAEKIQNYLDAMKKTGEYEVHIPTRTPSFCPGCPHRDSSSVLLELRKDMLNPQYMQQKHQSHPVDLVAHGDTGCYTMLMFEPNKALMHNYSGMGLGGGTGLGIDSFIENKQIVFLGDGTFYHSGLVAITQSIYNNQDITYIILDNKITAMTGHQSNASHETDLSGNPTFGLEIEKIVKSMVPQKIKKDIRITSIDPADRNRYRALLEEMILSKGVKIIIADKECGITYHRRVKSQDRKQIKALGYLPKKTYMNVATEVCEFCLECTTQTGCPGLSIVDSDYGSKVQTDMSWCVNDGACHRIHACPSFEELTIIRKQPKKQADQRIQLENIPQPPRPIHAEQAVWRCYLAGVGGMGIGLCNSILITAGHAMGYHVQFLDKKGLAIRNGGVFSQLMFTRHHLDDVKSPFVRTPQIPYGKADLLLGVDLLEATRGLDPKLPYRVASPQCTVAVVNTANTPTIMSLMGKETFSPNDLQTAIKKYTNKDFYFGFNVGDLSERLLDSKLYVNIMMLGMAYQKGYIPLSMQALEDAIKKVARQDTDRNLRAFNIGRKIVQSPELFVVEPVHQVENAQKAFRRKVNLIRATHTGRKGRIIAKRFRILMKKTMRATRGMPISDKLIRDVIIRSYDCFVWGGMPYAEAYATRLQQVFLKDSAEHNYKMTKQVVWNLAKVMLIKDEIYVSQLLTSPEKYKRDKRRYNVNTANGDKIIYKHHNRPEFELFGKKICFELKAKDWQLRIMAKMQCLRKLLPSWHKKEKQFRDWYMGLVDSIDWTENDSANAYQRWVAIVSTPQQVRGYRKVRYPKQEKARQLTQQYLAMDPEKFEILQAAKVEKDYALPVIVANPQMPPLERLSQQTLITPTITRK